MTDDQKVASQVNADNSFKQVLNCLSIVSHGFFQAYDDADTTPVCTSPPTAQRDIHLLIRVLRV
jgi:hypothetical protein